MNEVGGLAVRGISGSPDSDCNSNHHGSASYLSNASSQDNDFIQDNSDYQWFLDYGYRDGGINHHTSILSLPETYGTNDLNYYEALAKNMDANLAEADIESFKTEDIHALLTNLPPMCTDHLSQENNRQGESFASVSGSMMTKFDFDSSLSPHSSSHGEDSANSISMSIYKSELLFSPVKELPMPGANFSVDSLDCDMMLTCQANKDNYTIAFEGSILYSEDSDYLETDKSESSALGTICRNNKKQNNTNKLNDGSMTQSDLGSFTTWSKLKKLSSDNQLRRHPSGNNNISSDDTSQFGSLSENTIKSQSMPNLYKKKLQSLVTRNSIKMSNVSDNISQRKPVKVFNIQYQSSSGSGVSVSDMATSVDTSASDTTINKHHPSFNLVKLFMKQKSMSTEGMSTTMDQLSSTENWSEDSNGADTKTAEHLTNEQKNSTSGTKAYDFIVEEVEEDISRSESIEQLSESISKNDSVGNSFEQTKSFPESSNNNNGLNEYLGKSKVKISSAFENNQMSRSIQTSQFSEITNLKKTRKVSCKPSPYNVIEPSFLNKLKQEGETQKPVYVLYPNYVLPNLDFLSEKHTYPEVLLVPQKAPKLKSNSKRRPFSCNDLEFLKKKGLNHVKDWDSLNFLLPPEYRNILREFNDVDEHTKEKCGNNAPRQRRQPSSFDYAVGMNPTSISSSSSTATQPSSGYRGSSTLLSDSQNSPAQITNLNPLFVYRYDSVTNSEASLLTSEKNKSITTAPPLPTRCVSLQQGGHIPPRPPLPRSILRKDKLESTKRYSLYETSEEDLTEETIYKRRSLQEPYFLRYKKFSETEDEGVDAGTSSSSFDEPVKTTSRLLENDFVLSNMSSDELVQLEEFFKVSGISTSDNEEMNEENLMQLRSYVGKFLALKINQEGAEHFGGKKTVSFAEKINVLPKYLESKEFIAPNNSPNVPAFVQPNNYCNKPLIDMPICEENESSLSYGSPQTTPIHKSYINFEEKRQLVNVVTDAVKQLVGHFSNASNQAELNILGDSSINPTCARIALTTLCPALYAILSDGLKPTLESSFGAINNSVWQVVEASAQQGHLTKALNELVMRINSEDAITEGLVKFNAFVFGLLNVRSLDAFISYLKTRESILKKHYTNDSMFNMAHTGGFNIRNLLDSLISTLHPLALLPFQLDLLFEYRQLHLSFKRMDSYQKQLSPTHKFSSTGIRKPWNSPKKVSSNAEITTQNFGTDSELPDLLNSSKFSKCKGRADKERPRSCIETGMLQKPNFKLGDVTTAAKKRWSGISMNSKMYLVYDRLAKGEDEEYTDSLENYGPHAPVDYDHRTDASVVEDNGPTSIESNLSEEKPLNGVRFKRLQERWEMLSGRESSQSPPSSPTNNISKSKIPRPLTSPVKPSGIPILKSPSAKSIGKTLKKNQNTPVAAKQNIKTTVTKKGFTTPRTSRVDMETNSGTPRHVPRPSSLPYKGNTTQNSKLTNISTPRRAASTSLNRKINKPVPKTVRTLSHRVPSECGHLSYNEGEKLKVVLEVDDKWLLCCRGTQKGLVPKSAVISVDNSNF